MSDINISYLRPYNKNETMGIYLLEYTRVVKFARWFARRVHSYFIIYLYYVYERFINNKTV